MMRSNVMGFKIAMHQMQSTAIYSYTSSSLPFYPSLSPLFSLILSRFFIFPLHFPYPLLPDPNSWFDLSSPCALYNLKLSNPYDRAVAFALLRLVATHQRIVVSDVTYDGQELQLKQVMCKHSNVTLPFFHTFFFLSFVFIISPLHLSLLLF